MFHRDRRIYPSDHTQHDQVDRERERVEVSSIETRASVGSPRAQLIYIYANQVLSPSATGRLNANDRAGASVFILRRRSCLSYFPLYPIVSFSFYIDTHTCTTFAGSFRIPWMYKSLVRQIRAPLYGIVRVCRLGSDLRQYNAMARDDE